MEEIINKIENILNEKKKKFHSCNDENCKFKYYCEISNHKSTDDFFLWVRENKKELKKNKINEILNLLKNQNEYETYKKILKQIYFWKY